MVLVAVPVPSGNAVKVPTSIGDLECTVRNLHFAAHISHFEVSIAQTDGTPILADGALNAGLGSMVLEAYTTLVVHPERKRVGLLLGGPSHVVVNGGGYCNIDEFRVAWKQYFQKEADKIARLNEDGGAFSKDAVLGMTITTLYACAYVAVFYLAHLPLFEDALRRAYDRFVAPHNSFDERYLESKLAAIEALSAAKVIYRRAQA